MAVSTTTNRAAFSGDGATTVFAFPYPVLTNTDVKVISTVTSTGVSSTLVKDTDYTVALVGSQVNGIYPGGANITMVVAPASTKKLILYRDPAVTQATHWTDNDPMPSGTTETTHDKAVLLLQRVKELTTRAMGLADGFSATFTPTLPGLLPANSSIVINATADGIAMGPTTDTIAAAITSAAAAAVSATSAATSATASASSATASASSATASAASASAAATSAAAAAASAASAAAVFGTVVSGETPSGTVNGSNVTFTLAHTPNTVVPFALFLDGLRETGFTRTNATITMSTAPATGQALVADYNF